MAFFNNVPGKQFVKKNSQRDYRNEGQGEKKYGTKKQGKYQDENDAKRDFKSSFGKPFRGRQGNNESQFKDRFSKNERAFDKDRSFSKDRRFGAKERSSNKDRFAKADRRFEQEVKTPNYLKYEYEKPAKAPRTPDRVIETTQEESFEQNENLLVGRNPIREALKSGRDIEKLLVLKGEMSGSASEIIAKAKALKIPVQEVEKKRLDQIAGHHQGLIAFASAYQYHDLDDILNLAEQRGEAPFIVMLDGVTDPHNLGAIIRSAECAGAHGVIIPQRRSAGLTATAVKASAGAVEHIMVARVTNLKGVVDSLKRKGLWVYAADMDGDNYDTVDFAGPCLLMIGSEGDGIGQLLLESADKKVSISMKGKIESLNASVAAGILLFQIAKGR